MNSFPSSFRTQTASLLESFCDNEVGHAADLNPGQMGHGLIYLHGFLRLVSLSAPLCN